MNLSDLLATASGPCDCSACKGDPQHIQITGAALEAVHDYRDTLKRLDAEKKAANKVMWDAIHAGTGTEHLADADVTLSTEYLDIGIAILKVPAGMPLEKPEPFTPAQERHADSGGPPDELLDDVEPAADQPVATAA